MDSIVGAEICEVVEIHILSLLPNKLDKQSTGLHNDDGLVLSRNKHKQKANRDIMKIFKNAGLQKEIKKICTLLTFWTKHFLY